MGAARRPDGLPERGDNSIDSRRKAQRGATASRIAKSKSITIAIGNSTSAPPKTRRAASVQPRIGTATSPLFGMIKEELLFSVPLTSFMVAAER